MDILADYITNLSQVNEDIIEDLVQYGKAFDILSITDVMNMFVSNMLSTPNRGRDKNTFEAIDKAFEHIAANDDSSSHILISLVDSKISPYDYESLDYAYKKLQQLEEGKVFQMMFRFFLIKCYIV